MKPLIMMLLLTVSASAANVEPELSEVYSRSQQGSLVFKNTPLQVIDYVLKARELDATESNYLISKIPAFADLISHNGADRTFKNKSLGFWADNYLYEILVRQPMYKDAVVFIVYNYKDGKDMRLTGCVTDSNFRIQNSIVIEGTNVKRGLNYGQKMACEFLKNVWLSQDLTKPWIHIVGAPK